MPLEIVSPPPNEPAELLVKLQFTTFPNFSIVTIPAPSQFIKLEFSIWALPPTTREVFLKVELYNSKSYANLNPRLPVLSVKLELEMIPEDWE